ncbi:PREDICTED: complement component C8 gamma chain [Lipotes vexillifer]|uniref:Complement component C8 gamma chain n=1 Tax=Lipotes vexillifer TaxID=118797 RepID=A0A340XCB3_LIPVE|nr:PREDICTED: complement component C8 gamma chain [Lipotes vexillifer]
MLPPRTASLLTLLLAVGSLGQRAQRPPRPPSPISAIQPKANFDAQRFSGTWFLVAVASVCRSLQEQGHQAEATTLHVTPQGAAMAVSTFRKLDGICWQVQQLYGDTGLPGRFLLQARGARGAVDVVVGETDYRGFAILYLERARRLSVKLYTRSLPVSESFLSVFEQRVQGANLTEDHTLFFPKYGFCEAADQFHILDGEWAAPVGRCGRGLAARSSLLVGSRLCCRSEEVRPAAALHQQAAKALKDAYPASSLTPHPPLLGESHGQRRGSLPREPGESFRANGSPRLGPDWGWRVRELVIGLGKAGPGKRAQVALFGEP